MPIFNSYFLSKGKLSPGSLEQAGPVVQVEISIPPALAEYLNQQRKAIPQPIVGKALIDTGASVSAVDENIIRNLDISPVGIRKVLTPSGQAQQNTYPIQISFPGTPLPSLSFNEVLGSSLQDQNFVALIGRDVLRHFILIYNGVGGHYSLSH